MELLDLEQAKGGARPRAYREENSKSLCGSNGRPLITLRKYSPIICLIELITIALFVYLLLFHRASKHEANQLQECSRQAASNVDKFLARKFIWDNKTQGKFLELDLVPGCDQRKHDHQMSVQCSSKSADLCKPVGESTIIMPSQLSDKKFAHVIETSKKGDRLKRSTIELKSIICVEQDCRHKTRLELDPNNKKGQKIIGWGGALTDSTINNLLSLSTNGTRQLLRDYFGPEGLMFNLVRITIGGSDFSSRFYTNDDSLKGDDLNLTKFKLCEEDILYKMPVLKMVQQEVNGNENLVKRNLGPLKLFASMWSPPTWMKTNNHFNKGQLKGHIDDEPLINGVARKQELYYNALAELKVRFLRAYQRESINFWGLTVMNEPQFSIQPFLDFNTMIFPRDDYANYVAKYLGPKLKGDPQLKHLKLMAHDDNRRFLPNFTWPLLERTRTRQFLDGVSVHGYADEAYHLMSETYEKYHDNRLSSSAPDANFFVLPTELCSGHLPFMAKALIGNWHRGVHYALDIIRSLQHAAAGWVDWNMALDLEGGPGWLGGRLDAPVIVDKTRDLYHKSPMFYVLGQFSRHIPPGSIKLNSNLFNGRFDHQFEVISFELPHAVGEPPMRATVVVNNNPYPIELYSQRLSASSQSKQFYTLPCSADSVMTFIYPMD